MAPLGGGARCATNMYLYAYRTVFASFSGYSRTVCGLPQNPMAYTLYTMGPLARTNLRVTLEQADTQPFGATVPAVSPASTRPETRERGSRQASEDAPGSTLSLTGPTPFTGYRHTSVGLVPDGSSRPCSDREDTTPWAPVARPRGDRTRKGNIMSSIAKDKGVLAPLAVSASLLLASFGVPVPTAEETQIVTEGVLQVAAGVAAVVAVVHAYVVRLRS